MLKQLTYIPLAEQTRMTLLGTSSSGPVANSSSLFGEYNHLTSDGWLTPVVNPYSYGMQGQESPESEAFMVELQAAWRDWVKDGSKGANAAGSLGYKGVVLWTWAAVGIVVGSIAI